MFPPPPLSDTSSTGSPPPLHHRPRLPPPNNWADSRRQDITDISDVMQNFRPCKYYSAFFMFPENYNIFQDLFVYLNFVFLTLSLYNNKNNNNSISYHLVLISKTF